MNCGIYKILNIITGKFYIGSAIEIEKRWREHRHYLRNNTHANSYFQFAWNKYGEENFKFLVIQLYNKEDLLKYEQIWLNWTKCFERNIGYNILTVAANSLGYIHTKENRIKMRNAQLGSKQSEETINLKAAATRNLDRWPHINGCRCKCHECNWKKTEYVQAWQARKKIKCLNLTV